MLIEDIQKRLTKNQILRQRIFDRDKGHCFYCGKLVYLDQRSCTTFDFAAVDHLTPPMRGGSDGDSNLVLACWQCNSQKQNRTLEEYREFHRFVLSGHSAAIKHLEESLEAKSTPFDECLYKAIQWLKDSLLSVQFYGEAVEKTAPDNDVTVV